MITAYKMFKMLETGELDRMTLCEMVDYFEADFLAEVNMEELSDVALLAAIIVHAADEEELNDAFVTVTN